RWLKTAAGRAAAAGYRRTLGALDAWGAAAAHPAATDVVYYDRVPTPLGSVFAALGRRGLVRVAFERSERRFVAELAGRRAGPIVRSRRHLSAIRHALGGRSGRLAVAVDLAGVSPFQRRVLTAARRIPAGRVVSYGDLARRIGQPRACRAVGQALGRNPVPI